MWLLDKFDSLLDNMGGGLHCSSSVGKCRNDERNKYADKKDSRSLNKPGFVACGKNSAESDFAQSRAGNRLVMRAFLNALIAFLLAFSTLFIASEAYAASTVTVPDVTGKTLQEAVNTLQSRNLKYKIADGCSNYVRAKVTDQNPYSRSKVSQGTTVTLWTKQQETVIDEMVLGYYYDVVKEDGTTDKQLIQFPKAEEGWIPWIQEKNASVQLALSVKWRGESYVLSSNSDSGISNSDIQWGSSDTNIATVDRGLVKATGAADGDVTITCTLINKNYTPSAASEPITAQIVVRVIGQQGAYPIGMVIVDEYDVAIGSAGIVFEKADGTSEYQAYVRVKYSDGSYKCNAKYCDPSRYSKEISGLTWRTGNEKIAVVGQTTGLVSPAKNGAGSTELVATMTGGKNGELSSAVYITIKGLGEVQPASTLTVNVVYEKDRTEVVSSKIYNTSTLAQASQSHSFVQAAYTQTKSTGGFRTVSAEGVYLDDILADSGVKDTQNVYGLILKANDGVNNGFVPGGALFQKANYYFPNFDAVSSTGVHNTSGGVKVYPMVAVRSYSANESTDVDFTKMDGNYCFELCLGNNGGTLDDTTARYSIHWAYEITVVLNGAPKTHLGNDEDGSGEEIGNGSGNQGEEGQGQTGTDNEGQGQGGSGVDEENNSSGGDEGDSNNSGKNITLGIGGEKTDQPLNDASQSVGAAASEASQSFSEAEETQQERPETEEVEEQIEETTSPEDSKRWQVYEMMSKTKDDFDLDYNNPLEPFMIPAALGIAAVSGTRTVVRTRKEQGRPITFGKKGN